MNKPVVLAGILLIAAGLVGIGITYRQMKLERHLHDKLAGVPLQLGEARPEASAPFTTFGPGLHALYLATLVPARPHAGHAAFAGTVDYTLTDAAGRIRYMGRILPGMTDGPFADSGTVIPLDTVYIPDAGAELRLTARVVAADTAFTQTQSELFLMPPVEPAFGANLRRQSMFMVVLGGVVVIGFSLIVFGGSARRPHD